MNLEQLGISKLRFLGLFTPFFYNGKSNERANHGQPDHKDESRYANRPFSRWKVVVNRTRCIEEWLWRFG